MWCILPAMSVKNETRPDLYPSHCYLCSQAGGLIAETRRDIGDKGRNTHITIACEILQVEPGIRDQAMVRMTASTGSFEDERVTIEPAYTHCPGFRRDSMDKWASRLQS